MQEVSKVDEAAFCSFQKNAALVLNADFRPLSYYPLSLWNWQDAIRASISNRVNIIAEYDEGGRSPSVEIKIPSVVVLKQYIRPTSAVSYTHLRAHETYLHLV